MASLGHYGSGFNANINGQITGCVQQGCGICVGTTVRCHNLFAPPPQLWEVPIIIIIISDTTRPKGLGLPHGVTPGGTDSQVPAPDPHVCLLVLTPALTCHILVWGKSLPCVKENLHRDEIQMSQFDQEGMSPLYGSQFHTFYFLPMPFQNGCCE